MRCNCMSKAPRFLQLTAVHQDRPFFTVFLAIKASSKSISITPDQQIPLKLHEHRGGYQRNDFGQSLLQTKQVMPSFCSYDHSDDCNPDHNKFSSLSKTTTTAIFHIFVYGYVVYAQTWEVLTLKNCISSHLMLMASRFLYHQFSYPECIRSCRIHELNA